jgi:hypothetical protein
VDSLVSTLFSRGSASRPDALRYGRVDRVFYRRSDKRATALENQNNSIVPPRERRQAVRSRSEWGRQSENGIACLCFLIRITVILCLSMRRDASSQASSDLIAPWGFQRNLVNIFGLQNLSWYFEVRYSFPQSFFFFERQPGVNQIRTHIIIIALDKKRRDRRPIYDPNIPHCDLTVSQSVIIPIRNGGI